MDDLAEGEYRLNSPFNPQNGPGPKIDLPEMQIIVADEGRVRNHRLSQLRNLPEFTEVLASDKPVTGPIAIIGGGPSLRKTIGELRRRKWPVMASGSTYSYLTSQRVIPDYAVNLDPDCRMPEYFGKPQEKTTFLIASHSDARLFDFLRNHKVITWIGAGEIPEDEFTGRKGITGGSTVTTRAWTLAWLMGYRKFHFYGVDSSFPKEDDQHADRANPDIYNHTVRVRVDGSKTEYLTSFQLMKQTQEFMHLYSWCRAQGGLMWVHGESLTAEYARVFERQRRN